MPTAQELVNQGYEGYAGWGDDEAAANFRDTGGSGKEGNGGGGGGGGGSSGGGGGGGGGMDVNSILQNAINAVLGAIPKPPKPYDEVNPFFFDEALAKEAATAEYAPYYQELLNDYISDVERTKGRSTEDLNRTLTQLEAGKEYYVGKERRTLDKALKNVNEGWAGRGLFFSGMRPKEVEEVQTEYNADLGEYLRGYDYSRTGAELNAKRTGEDLGLGQERYTRDIGREKDTAIAGGVLQRKSEVRDEYEMSRQKYYDNSRYGSMYS